MSCCLIINLCFLCRYTKMKTATNIYIFNLALADALVTSTLPFQSVNYLMGTWPFGDMLCKMVMSIDYYNMFTSIFTLTTMSIDRYVAVCHPVKALDFRTPRNAKIVNVCNWILSSAIGLPVMFMASTAVTRKHEYTVIPAENDLWTDETLCSPNIQTVLLQMEELCLDVTYSKRPLNIQQMSLKQIITFYVFISYNIF